MKEDIDAIKNAHEKCVHNWLPKILTIDQKGTCENAYTVTSNETENYFLSNKL